MRFSTPLIIMAAAAVNIASTSAKSWRPKHSRPKQSRPKHSQPKQSHPKHSRVKDEPVKSRRRGPVKRFDFSGENIDIQTYDDEPSYSCRLHPGQGNGKSRGNPKFCTTSGGASVMVLESEEKGNNKHYIASIIDPITGMTYYKDENGEITERHSSDYPPEEDTDDDIMSTRRLRNGLRGAAISHDATSTDASNRQLVEDGSVIDLLVIWTRKAHEAGNMKNIINAAIARTNEAFSNSGIPTTIRLVHSQMDTDNFDDSGSARDALYALTDSGDGNMDYVHNLRKKHGADLVMVLTGGTGCGIAWINASYNYGFSAVNWSCAVENLTFAHELGHNLNCNHDRGSKSCPSGTNYGYRDPQARFRSVMAYGCQYDQCDNIVKGGSCARMPFFSTPDSDYLWKGLPQGNKMTDNASAIRKKMVQVANFEQSNVSTTTTTTPTTTTTTATTTTTPTTATTTPTTTTTTTTPTTTTPRPPRPTTTTNTPTTTTTTTTPTTTTTTTTPRPPRTTTTTTTPRPPRTTTTTTTPPATSCKCSNYSRYGGGTCDSACGGVCSWIGNKRLCANCSDTTCRNYSNIFSCGDAACCKWKGHWRKGFCSAA